MPGTGKVFDRVRNAVAVIVTVLLLLTLLSVAANAQDTTSPTARKQQFIIFADTLGIAAMPGVSDVYVTWVYALSTPTSYPSSAVLVAWDCQNGKVKRLSHVVYRMKADSTGVEGPVIDDNGGWVEPVDPRLYQLVCTIGPTHAPIVEEDSRPAPRFAPDLKRSEV